MAQILHVGKFKCKYLNMYFGLLLKAERSTYTLVSIVAYGMRSLGYLSMLKLMSITFSIAFYSYIEHTHFGDMLYVKLEQPFITTNEWIY